MADLVLQINWRKKAVHAISKATFSEFGRFNKFPISLSLLNKVDSFGLCSEFAEARAIVLVGSSLPFSIGIR